MPTISIHVLSLALCLASGFQQGYIASVLNQPYLEIENYMNVSWYEQSGKYMSEGTQKVLWSILNICFPVATIFGQFLAQFLCKRIGRKKTTMIATFLYIPGALISAAAKWIPDWFELLYVGRIVWSLANGVTGVTATVWIVECAPPEVRGRMASVQELFMAVGSLMTQAFGIPFTNETLWPMNFVCNIAFSIVPLVLLFFVSESPQYILERLKDEKAARAAIASYYGKEPNSPEVDAEINHIMEGVKKKELDKKLAECGEKNGPNGFEIMFMPWRATDDASKVYRHGAWVGVMVKIAYVFTGARSLRAYSTFILHELGGWTMNQAEYLSLITGLLRLPITLVPIFLVDRVGRRPLILGSTFISLLSLVLMIVSVAFGPSWKIGTMVGLTVLLLINACGLGSVSRFYSAELVPRSLLLSSVSTLTMFEQLTKIGVEFAWYPVANIAGPPSFLMFAGPTLVFLVLMWWLCPETSRRTVNEVLNIMAAKMKLDITFPLPNESSPRKDSIASTASTVSTIESTEIDETAEKMEPESSDPETFGPETPGELRKERLESVELK